VLGDSYAFGWGVEFEQSFSGVLQAAHPEWDVRNAAVAGYGADQELLVLRRLVGQLRPTAVVCNFCDNDLWESSADEAYGRSKPQFVSLRGDLALRASHVDASWLSENSMLYAAIRKHAWQSRFEAAKRDRSSEWQMVERLYCTMRDELQGVPFVLVSEEPQWGAFALRERGIVHVDVREALGSAGVPTRFPVDGHWNAAGHAAVAARLGQALASTIAAQSK
jgi:lysophospholipase L1-like esterase